MGGTERICCEGRAKRTSIWKGDIGEGIGREGRGEEEQKE